MLFKNCPLIVLAAAASLSIFHGQATAEPPAGCRITPHDLPPPALPDGVDIQADGPWHDARYRATLPDGSVLYVRSLACEGSHSYILVGSNLVVPHCEPQLNCDLADKIVALATMAIGATALADKVDDLKRELSEHGLEPFHARRHEDFVRVKTILEYADEDVGFFEFWYQDGWAPLLLIIGFNIQTDMAIAE